MTNWVFFTNPEPTVLQQTSILPWIFMGIVIGLFALLFIGTMIMEAIRMGSFDWRQWIKKIKFCQRQNKKNSKLSAKTKSKK